MISVRDMILHMLPNGTRDLDREGKSETVDHSQFPIWPPDMFAVCAQLVDMSGCYARLLGPKDEPMAKVLKADYRKNLKNMGLAWQYLTWSKDSKSLEALTKKRVINKDTASIKEADIQAFWDILISSEDSVSSQSDWNIAALSLMIIADEASTGIGFHESDRDESWITAHYTIRNLLNSVVDVASTETKQEAAYTACIKVPADIACVQPKTRTPKVGCTLRSLSLNLALLPPRGQVATRWNQFPAPSSEAFNLLVIPFPYVISGRCFRPSRPPDMVKTGSWDLFAVDQNWLPKDEANPKKCGELVAAFISDVIKAAGDEVSHVDGIVLPELALDVDTFTYVEEVLRERRYPRLGFFVSGVYSEPSNTNNAFTAVFIGNSDDDGKAEYYHHLSVSITAGSWIAIRSNNIPSPRRSIPISTGGKTSKSPVGT